MAGNNDTVDGTTIKDDIELLNAEDDLEVKEPEVEDEEEEKLEVEGEGEELEEGKEKTEKSTDFSVGFKDVTKKYPNLFKDFPNLRHIFFHEKEYREIFPSVDEAKEAVEELSGLRELETALTSGTQQDVEALIDSFKELGDNVIPNFANNFLPSLKTINQELYYQVITPELVNFTRSMFDAGLRNENDNLKNAALVAAQHFFGDPKVASGEKEIKLPKHEVKKDETLERERQNFRAERYSIFYNDTVKEADTKLSAIVSNGIDPKEDMTEGMKELAIEKVMKEVMNTLSANPSHVNRMNALWKKAGEQNFPLQWKSKIISAYLEAAKEIVPKIRARVRANILGIRERQPASIVGGSGGVKRIEPKSSSGSGGSSRSSSNQRIDHKKIDWKKTSDIDFLKDNVTLRKE